MQSGGWYLPLDTNVSWNCDSVRQSLFRNQAHLTWVIFRVKFKEMYLFRIKQPLSVSAMFTTCVDKNTGRTNLSNGSLTAHSVQIQKLCKDGEGGYVVRSFRSFLGIHDFYTVFTWLRKDFASLWTCLAFTCIHSCSSLLEHCLTSLSTAPAPINKDQNHQPSFHKHCSF